MWLWMGITSVWAVAPDREVAVLGDPTATVDRVSVAADGSVVAAVSGSVALVVSADSWESWTTSPCTVKAVAAAGDGVWVGCEDGSVRRVPVTDAGPGTAESAIDLGEDEVIGLWLVDTTLWVLTQGPDPLALLSVVPVDTTTNEAATDRAFAPPYRGYVDGLVSNGTLYLLHGTTQITAYTLATGVGAASLTSGMGPSGADLAPATVGAYAVDTAGSLWQFNPQFLSWSPLMYELGAASAVGSSVADSWVGVVADGEFTIWAMDDLLVGNAVDSFAVDTSIVDVAVASNGYTYAAGAGLFVWTANPWVDDLVVAPATVSDGVTVNVTFTLDRAADWSVHRGGDSSGSGTVLASGHASAAGPVTTSFVADGLEEGANRLYVVAKVDALTGHARGTVTADNPPDAPGLGAGNLTFGDQSLTLSFDGIPDADLDHYDVYVAVADFAPADWPTGGPLFDGTDALTTPIRVDAAGGERVTLRISPLTNGTTYHVAVRSFDQGGLMSSLSAVISGTPQETFSASELAGDDGGPYCATTPAGALATAFAALLVASRRRSLAGLLLLAPGAALADEGAPAEVDPKRDLTLARGDFEMRYGGFVVEDPAITGVYGATGNQMFQLEAGIQPFNAWLSSVRTRKEASGQRFENVPRPMGFFEIDVGLGFFQELDHLVTDDPDAVAGGDVTMLTMWPLMVDGTLRLQLLDEQFVVPYVRGGLDYVIWDERWDNASGGKDKVHGAKSGNHYGGGVQILLDPLSPARASLLEAQSGINDTYFVIEWRKQNVEKAVGGDETGMTFSGTMTTFGLKMDF